MTQTANNYGEVLFELGIKKDTVEESKRIFSLTEQLHRTLESPIISKNEKYSIIEKVFPKEIENFLKVVCDHEKMSYIDEIIEAYYKKYNEANNILTVDSTVSDRDGAACASEYGDARAGASGLSIPARLFLSGYSVYSSAFFSDGSGRGNLTTAYHRAGRLCAGLY